MPGLLCLQVYKALLHDITEVAAKRLHASSESQIALFKREISIHKQCRSVRLFTQLTLSHRSPD